MANQSKPVERREVSILSPLRYPGGKKRLAAYVAETLRVNGLTPEVLVEPFAGGASVALQLAYDGWVDSIVLGEADPLVASFWKIVFNDPDWLVGQVDQLEISVDEWQRVKQSRPRSDRDRALACLYLNRTSFSGILAPSAGPIGGLRQSSDYGIDCRFPRETIKRRIRKAATLSDRVLGVVHGSWRETIRRVQALRFRNGEVFYYLDPPFFHKADRLYSYFFLEEDHRRLHNRLVQLKQPWLLSYDAAPEALKMYAHNGLGPQRIDMLYSSAAQGGPSQVQELIITNLSHLPDRTRLWRSKSEWVLRRKDSKKGSHG